MNQMAPEIIEQYKQEIAPLALRVRDGNDKCIAVWLKIQDLDDQTFQIGMDKIMEAQEKLDVLCSRLQGMQEVLESEGQCLYIMNKKKIKKCAYKQLSPGGKLTDTWCWVCPSAHPWWREEWAGFDAAMAMAKVGASAVPATAPIVSSKPPVVPKTPPEQEWTDPRIIDCTNGRPKVLPATLVKPEVVLGMPVDQVISLWKERGSPIIVLRRSEDRSGVHDFEKCLDLAKLLSHQNVCLEHLTAIKTWLEEIV
jgi:hypothetical protein